MNMAERIVPIPMPIIYPFEIKQRMVVNSMAVISNMFFIVPNSF